MSFVFSTKALFIEKMADKRYTVVHHLGYKVHHQAQHQAHLTWCCTRQHIPYGKMLSAKQMPRMIKMQREVPAFFFFDGLYRRLALLIAT